MVYTGLLARDRLSTGRRLFDRLGGWVLTVGAVILQTYSRSPVNRSAVGWSVGRLGLDGWDCESSEQTNNS